MHYGERDFERYMSLAEIAICHRIVPSSYAGRIVGSTRKTPSGISEARRYDRYTRQRRASGQTVPRADGSWWPTNLSFSMAIIVSSLFVPVFALDRTGGPSSFTP